MSFIPGSNVCPGPISHPPTHVVITATNDEGGEVNVAFDHSTSPPSSATIPEVAKRLKLRGEPWALVVDDNYGEGSAREHAAMQPRFLGCGLIVARSFARWVTFFSGRHGI